MPPNKSINPDTRLRLVPVISGVRHCMNHLSHIVDQVKASGLYEERWNVLVNTYFRGQDCFEQIEHWASANGLRVSFSNEHRTCTFQAIQDQAK